MSDREAFVSAIAANPADDLPRLVFADWLDEHGDPERAEFIRTQVRWHHATDANELKQLDARAGELFRDHWMRWFGSFILSLEPNTNPGRWPAESSAEAGYLLPFTPQLIEPGAGTPAVAQVLIRRGFVSTVIVDVKLWRETASLATALQHEPVTVFACIDGLHSRRWSQFTDPALRRVSTLYLTQQWAWGFSAPDSGALLEDPHLAGVRSFTLSPLNDNLQPTPLPVAWLERFVRSSLAYRLTGLNLPSISSDGVAPLCRPGRLHLERLELGGELSDSGVRRLGGSELGGTVRELKLNKARLGNTGVAALARDPWRKLTHLELKENDLSTAVLPALTSAAFLPQLKVLDLSGNQLFTHAGDEDRLRPLAEALDPERLEHLDLTDTGLSVVPDFLAERFGDRVTV